MINARRAVGEMSDAVCGCVRRNPNGVDPQKIAVLRVLEDSIVAKLHMAEHDAALLSRASLEELSRLEDSLSDRPRVVSLMSNDDWEITIKSPRAGILARFMAFSGSVSSCVNAADTLGRYLGVAYDISTRQPEMASLRAVCGKLCVTSSLHAVLSDSPGLDWMEKLRDLRGECQHGKLAGSHYRNPWKSSEPLVPSRFCENEDEVTISAYLGWAMARTAELLTKTAQVVAADPEYAVRLKL